VAAVAANAWLAMSRERVGALLARLHVAQQAFYAGGEDRALREVLCADVVWHVPGRSAIAGTYTGVEAVLAYFARRSGVAARTFRMQPAAVLAGGSEHAAAITHGTATVDGRSERWSTVGLYRIREGRVAECRLLPFDQDELTGSGLDLDRRAKPRRREPMPPMTGSASATRASGAPTRASRPGSTQRWATRGRSSTSAPAPAHTSPRTAA
jgi:ketosteroid isomerase-like protein